MTTDAPRNATDHDTGSRPRILPDRCYALAEPKQIIWTEQHLERVKCLRLFPDERILADKYTQRMIACRNNRRCNLLACPRCSMLRPASLVPEVLSELAKHRGVPIVSLDALLLPRDHLVTDSFSPLKDMREVRKIIKETLPGKNPCSYLWMLGRYEVAVKRRDESGYTQEFNPDGKKTRSVVPHFHCLLIAHEGGRYLNPRDFRVRLEPAFVGSRRLHFRSLDRRQTVQEAISARLHYIFKARTSEFAGRALKDFILAQVTQRQDTWFLKYQRGDWAACRELHESLMNPADLVFG